MYVQTIGIFMQISAIPNSKTNFGVNLRILKVLTLGENMQEHALRIAQELQGPMYAFVRRLNNDQFARETVFLKQRIPHFKAYPFVSGTSMATVDRYLIFGKNDIDTLRELCTDCYHKGLTSKVDTMREILERLIKPFSKKFRYAQYKGDKIGEPVGLVLHVNKIKSPNGKGKVYNFGIDITNDTGSHVYGVLHSAVPQVAQRQPQIRLPKLEQAEFNFS